MLGLGSTLATVVLSRDVAILEGIAAFVVLVGGQYAVAWACVRSALFRRVVKSQPTLVYYRGRFLTATPGRAPGAARERGLRVSDRVATGIELALDRAGIDMPYPHAVVLFHDVTGTRPGDVRRGDARPRT